MSMIGKRVQFAVWTADGHEVLAEGVVEEEFTEPESEDSLQRLNYRVRQGDGQVFTPYASECREAK